MTHTCLRDEELAQAVGPAGDSVRREAQACARCRARLAAFHEFVQPSSVPPGARPAEADLCLAAALEAEIMGVPPGGGVSAQPREAGARVPAPASRRRGWGHLRLAWAAAAVALLVWAGHEADLFERRAGDEILLREERSGTRPALRLNGPTLEAGGAVRLSWEAVGGADRYEVILHGEGYREIARLDAGAALHLALSAGELRRSSDSLRVTLWRVVARRGGDPIAQSAIRPLQPASP